MRFPAVAREDDFLRGAEKVDEVTVRLECLHYTRVILRKAGYLNPQPFRRYLVKIEERGGLLCVAR